MIKKFLFVLLLLPIVAFSQENPFFGTFPIKNNKIEYSDVVTVENVASSDLYKRSKIWLVDAFKSSKDVIQNDDKDNNIVIGKGFFSGSGHNQTVENAKYWFTIRIDSREGRYRYSITDILYDFDVVVSGQKFHNNVNFYEWGSSTALADTYTEKLSKKFKPGKALNERQQQEYDKLKSEYDELLQKQYDAMQPYYESIDQSIKNIISSMQNGMSEVEEEW